MGGGPAAAGLSGAEVAERRARCGYNEVVAEAVPEWRVLLGKYFGLVPLCMLLAAVVSVISESSCFLEDGVGLDIGVCKCATGRDWFSFALLIFEVNLIVIVDWHAGRNAGNAIKALKEMAMPYCRVRRDGEWEEIPVRELVPGDCVELGAGTVIPSDGVLAGEGEPVLLDESSLTGESLAVTKSPGEEILGGAVVLQGELEMIVTAIGADTFFGKTIALLSSVKEEGNIQKILHKVAAAMCVAGVVGILPIFFVLLFRDGTQWLDAIQLCLVILVGVLPVAMPVVTTTGLAVGAYELSREKAVVQRLSAIEEMAGMTILCSDKTGTLTKNELVLEREEIWCREGVSVGEVLRCAALAAKLDGGQEAIDKAISGALTAEEEREVRSYNVMKFVPFNPVDKRTETICKSAEGHVSVVSKGAPNVMLDLAADTEEVRQLAEHRINENAGRGLRSLGVARVHDPALPETDHTWQLIGVISLLDPPREDSKATLEMAQEKGVDIKMITGDALAIAIETASRLGMGTNIIGNEVWGHEGDNLIRQKGSLGQLVEEVNGFASVYPEHKFQIVQALQDRGHLIGMTGDGVNDAPALKKANVGIAVAGATDAAKGAADIVLTAPGLSTIITAIDRARKIFRRLNAYVMYRIASSVLILGFFFLSIIALRFEFPTWVLILLSVVNDFTAMSTSKDKVRSSDTPLKWAMTETVLVSSFIGLVGIVSNFLLLYLSLDEYGNWWGAFGLRDLEKCEVVAVIYLGLAITIQLNIFSTRNRSLFFFTSEKSGSPPLPSPVLLAPVLGSILIALFIAVYWPASWRLGGGASMVGVGWGHAGLTCAYAVVWFFVSDLLKAVVFHAIDNGGAVLFTPLVGRGLMESLKLKNVAAKKAKKEMQQQMLEEHGLEYELAAHSMSNYKAPLSAEIPMTPEVSADAAAAVAPVARGAQTVALQRRRTPLEALEKKVLALQKDNAEMRRLLEVVIQQLGAAEAPSSSRGRGSRSGGRPRSGRKFD